MQMNTVKHMDSSRAAMVFGALSVPSAVPAHPNLRQFRQHVLERIAAFDRFLEVSRGVPAMEYGDEGLSLAPRADWEIAYRTGAEALIDVQTGKWRPYLRAVRRHFPALAPRFEEAFDRSAEGLRETQILLAHLLGFELPVEDVDLSIPEFNPELRGPSVALDL